MTATYDRDTPLSPEEYATAQRFGLASELARTPSRDGFDAGMAVKREADREAVAAELGKHWIAQSGQCGCGEWIDTPASFADQAFREHVAGALAGVIREAPPKVPHPEQRLTAAIEKLDAVRARLDQALEGRQ